jgi:hypothetical protein
MNEKREVCDDCRRLRELLLAHLRAADAPRWPGADGVTVEEVLRSYPQAATAGLVPDLPTLLENHPELADLLREFFTAPKYDPVLNRKVSPNASLPGAP